jgi:hypothetical protein
MSAVVATIRRGAITVSSKVHAMPDPSEIRVSDQERERAAEEIRQHYAVGRLSEDELTERVQAAYDARTQSDLDALRTDLPRLPANRTEHRHELDERRRVARRHLIQRTGGALIPFVICLFIWAASGAGPFWPIWAALPAVIVLVNGGWQLYGPAPELDGVDKEKAHRDERAERRHAHRDRPGR